MTVTVKAAQNAAILMQAAVQALKAAGWTEAQIIPELPYLAKEAVNHLAWMNAAKI